MFKKTLIPLDGSETAELVLQPVARLIGRQDVGVTSLLRVCGPGEEAAAEDYLKAVRKRLMERSIPASVTVTTGDPAEQIVARASDEGHDLIAMASHGHGGITRWVRGSVAERVLRSSPVPLLLCTPRTLTPGSDVCFRRILVPHDGSELADEVLPLVQEVARLYGSRVVVLRVEPLALPDPEGRILARSEREVRAALEASLDRWSKAGLDLELRGELGDPAQRVLETVEALGIDLVALSTHGRSGWSRWWFGSVAEAVLRRCHAPLLVHRAQPGNQPGDQEPSKQRPAS
ncbi:MAG: universal stress protein [Planctomycetota bacterium]